MKRRLCVILATLAIVAARAGAQAVPDREARWLGLAKVWRELKVAHPAVLRGQVDPDAAMPAAIAKAEAATTKEAYAAAVNELVAPFHDPVTLVEDPASAPAPPLASGGFIEHPTPQIAVVTPAALATEPPAKRAELFGKLGQSLEGADVVVIDLRGPDAVVAGIGPSLSPALPRTDKSIVTRRVVHEGYRTQDGTTSGGYNSQLREEAVSLSDGTGKAKHVVFIADNRSFIPLTALLLQASGKATIVSPERLTDTTFWILTEDIALPYGLVAHIRRQEVAMADGSSLAADLVVAAPRSPRDAAIDLAKSIASGARPPAHVPAKVAYAGPAIVDDKDWPESPYPTRELRIFAGMKVWGILSKFYPYLELPNELDAELPHALAELEVAPDADAYVNALRAYGAHLHDGHVSVNRTDRPRGGPWIEVRLVQRTPIVTRVWEADAPVKVGDEVVAIGGVPVGKARETELRLTSGGTPSAREDRALAQLSVGPIDVPVELDVRGADGKVRRVSLPRHPAGPPPRNAPASYRMIGKLGYADLRDLTPAEIPAMFQAFAGAPAIILDMRGYPRGTAWPLTPYLNVKKATDGATFTLPVVDGGDRRPVMFIQPLVKNPAVKPYASKVIVLIDDRAVSQAEHSCLFFEQSANVTFIGTHTHGTNGDITFMRLPGGLRLRFTGQAVRHADGRQLQQVGIQPTLIAEPTVAGVRGGKDEVLDRAIRFATTGR